MKSCTSLIASRMAKLTDSRGVATRKRIYDAAVVGAGIVGLAAAVGLAQAGHRVALVEQRPPVRRRGTLGFDLRSVALTASSANLLRGLGAIRDADLIPIEAMRVWEYDGNASLEFTDETPLAQIAENSALTVRLWDVAANCMDIYAGSPVTGLAQSRDSIALRGVNVAARLVIAADGADSVVRRFAGTALRFEPKHRGGPQRAIATVARGKRGHGNVAFQRFGRSGPIALLPLGVETDVAVIWSAGEAPSRRLQTLDDDAFRAALDTETESVLGGFVAVDRRIAFPVRQAWAAHINPEPRILVVGDAARTLHPLAGQGVNVGLEDVRDLLGAASGADLGAPGRWRDFARRRRTRSKLMIAAMRGLLTAYCGPHADRPWMRLARNAGVRFIDGSPAMKAQLVREAMGLGPLALHRGSSQRFASRELAPADTGQNGCRHRANGGVILARGCNG